MFRFIPIKQSIEENQEFANNPDCHEALFPTIDFYKVIGFAPPWICYFAELNGKLVGSGGYKGQPVNNRIEIAYGTFQGCMNKGIGTEICRQLVLLAQATDPNVFITARTLPERNHSTKILEKNDFKLLGTVWDKDDGNVWEWQFEKHST